MLGTESKIFDIQLFRKAKTSQLDKIRLFG